MKNLSTDYFRLKLPERWEDNATLIISSSSTQHQPLQVSLNIIAVSEETSAEDFAQQQVKAFSEENTIVKLLSTGPFALANGEGHEIHSLWENEKGSAYHQWQLVVVNRQRAFVLLVSLPEEDFDKAKGEIEEIFRSFQLLEPPAANTAVHGVDESGGSSR